jgi:hypothetical protein
VSRDSVRQMRKVVTLGRDADATSLSLTQAQEAAAQLLERSVLFGHKRLSLARLTTAVQLGAILPLHHWNHCSRVAKVSADSRIRALYAEAVHAAQSAYDFPLPDL